MFRRNQPPRRVFLPPVLTRRLPGVLSTTEFERVFVRERARTDRYSCCFSLLVLDSTDDDLDELQRLTRLVLERIRSSDMLGWLDSRRLAAILPDTPGRGAWALADALIRQMALNGFNVDCAVFTYPASEASERGAAPAGDGTAAAEHAAQGEAPRPADLKRNASSREESGHKGNGHDGKVQPERRHRPHAQRQGPIALADGLESIRQNWRPRPISAIPGFSIQPLPRWKRVIDLVGGSLLLVVLSPLFALAALAVKLSSPGPVIFKQVRAGLGGRPFVMYKFRSMKRDAETWQQTLLPFNEQDGPVFKMRNDPRMTRVGRILRKSSIDELPQLWNVVKGDMTFVGPRPPTLEEVAHYQPWQRRRLALTGGLTCIWQVSGRSEIGFEEWVRMDLRYVERHSLLLDMRLVAKTARAVLSGRGAY